MNEMKAQRLAESEKQGDEGMEADKATKKEQGIYLKKPLAVTCNISGILNEKKLVKDINRLLAHQKKNRGFGQ